MEDSYALCYDPQNGIEAPYISKPQAQRSPSYGQQ